jgi:hypothetical protein
MAGFSSVVPNPVDATPILNRRDRDYVLMSKKMSPRANCGRETGALASLAAGT